MPKAVCPLCESEAGFSQHVVVPGLIEVEILFDDVTGELLVERRAENDMFWDETRVSELWQDTPFKCIECEGSFAEFKVVEA